MISLGPPFHRPFARLPVHSVMTNRLRSTMGFARATVTLLLAMLVASAGVVAAYAQNVPVVRDAEIEALYRGHRNADRFIRMEHLTEDLVSILQELEIHFDRSDFLPKRNINTSEHNDAAFYYDAGTIELVRQQEQLLISEFGYEPPVAAWASGSGIPGAPDAD